MEMKTSNILLSVVAQATSLRKNVFSWQAGCLPYNSLRKNVFCWQAGCLPYDSL